MNYLNIIVTGQSLIEAEQECAYLICRTCGVHVNNASRGQLDKDGTIKVSPFVELFKCTSKIFYLDFSDFII